MEAYRGAWAHSVTIMAIEFGIVVRRNEIFHIFGVEAKRDVEFNTMPPKFEEGGKCRVSPAYSDLCRIQREPKIKKIIKKCTINIILL